MGIFSKKEDTKHIKAFDSSLSDLNSLAERFRTIHFQTLESFQKNFEKEKADRDLQKERILSQTH
jgi:hypothetical protein